MAHKSQIPTVTLTNEKNITKELQDHNIIIIAPKKKEKQKTPELVAKTRKKLYGGGIASGMRRFNRGGKV